MASGVEAWRIYRVKDCPYVRPKTKDKYVVIVIDDGDDGWGFLINSEINVWIRVNDEKLACQAAIAAAEHPNTLDYDGFVDCIDLYRFESFLLIDPKDRVSENAKSAICEAVRNSTTIVRQRKRQILQG